MAVRVTAKRMMLTILGGILATGVPIRAGAEDEPLNTPLTMQSTVQTPAALEPEEKEGATFSVESFKNMIERLTVTARRREERVQRVPIAVSVLSEDDLARENKNRRLQDVQNLVPNLVFDASTGVFSSTSRLVLRGFGQADPTSTADPGVGVYVDGVYQARSTGLSLTPIDIDSIEVLRGPQGTLFGKNTVGGAISVTTRKPDFEPGGSAEVRYGNFNTIETRGVANVPLVPERAAARFSFATATRDGYQKNLQTGQELGDNKVLAGRAEFAVYPSENVEVLFTADASRENRKPIGGKCIPVAKAQAGGVFLGQNSGELRACRENAKVSEFKGASDFGNFEDSLRTYGGTGRVTWDVAPNLTFTSISGVRQNRLQTFVDFDATPVMLLGNDNDSGQEKQRQVSQEFQLTGNTDSGRLRYTLGLFGLNEDVNNREFLSLMVRITPAGGLQPNPALTEQRLKVRNRSYALYGQGVYSLSDRLELTLGARLSSERKRVMTDSRPTACRPGAGKTACRDALKRVPDFTGFDSVARFSDLSPMVTLSYEFSPKALAYVGYSTAFQSGGFQGNAQRVEDAVELDPQDVTSYEVGFKTRAFDDRLLFNASLFSNMIQDQRIPFTNVTADGNFTVTERNAAKTLVRGAELELGLLAAPGLQLFTSAGVLNSRFVEFDDDVPDPTLENNRPPFTPSFTFSFRVDYERELGNMGTLGLRSSWSVRGRMNTDAQATDELQTNKYGLLDGRLSWALPDGRTELAAYGTNLLDRRYQSNGISFADSIGIAVRTFGPPRFYGVEVRRSF